MKFRKGFVTNSSSSSFILAFDSKEDGIEKIISELKNLDPIYLKWVLEDYKDAVPLNLDLNKTLEEVCEDEEKYNNVFLSEAENKAWTELFYNNGFRNSEFVKEWVKNNPDKKEHEIYKDPEVIKKLNKITYNYYMDMCNELKDKKYIVELEYEDHTTIGSNLEHEILPNCNFVYKRISHH